MYLYWILFSAFAAGALLSKPQSEKAPLSVFLLIAATAMFLFIGLRWQVGADWIPYEEIYVDISRSDLLTAIELTEPGYALLNWIAVRLGLDIWAVNLVCALLFVWGLVNFARIQSNPWLAIVVAIPFMVIVVAMGYTRQGAAMGVAMLGLSSLNKNAVTRSFFLIIFASMFHRSAIILVPLVGLTYTRNKIQTFILMILASFFAYYFLLDAAIDRYSATYVEQVYQADGAGVRLAMNIIPSLLVLIIPSRLQLEGSEKRLWTIFALLGLLLNLLYLLIDSNVAIDRIGVYLIPFQMMALSRLPVAMGQLTNSKRIIPLTFAFFVTSYAGAIQFVWLNYATNAQFWVPYKSLLST